MPEKSVALRMSAKMAPGGVGEIVIEGEISLNAVWGDEATTQKLRKTLDALSGAKRLNIHINSPGGIADQGMAMRSLLMAHPAPEKHVYIEGLCASAATLPACIGAPVHMGEGARYMIHEPVNGCYGRAAQMRAMADRLDKLSGDVASIYSQQSGQSEETVREMMAKETWMSADEAVSFGFASDVIRIPAAMCAPVSLSKEEAGALGYLCAPVIAASQDFQIGDGPKAVMGEEGTNHHEEEEEEMEISKITVEQLREGNESLYRQILQEGAQVERERLMELDRLTAPGCEAMVQEAKYGEKPLSAQQLAYNIMVSEQMKGIGFLQARKEATRGAASVPAQGSPDDTHETDEMKAAHFGKELADLAGLY